MHETPAFETRIKAIAAKVAAGILPQTQPSRAWGASGSGHLCTACDAPIALGHMELDSELASGHRMPFHAACFTAWWRVLEARESADVRTARAS